MSQPLSNKAKPGSRFVILLIFVLVGLVFRFPIFLLPLFKAFRARGWNETPCVIVSSSVQKDASGGSPVYGVNITYRYKVGDRQYKGARYDFRGGLSSGYEAKAAIVQRYPPGKQTVCYVDPANPKESVLDRGMGHDLWIVAIVPAFILVFALRLVTSRRGVKSPPQAQWADGAPYPAALRRAEDFSAISLEPRELKPSATPGFKVGVSGVAVLVFGWLTWMAFSEFRGPVELGHGILTLIFGFFALLMAAAFVSSCLALSNPRIHLTLTPGAITPGQEFSLEWSARGRSGALARLRILLEGSEVIPSEHEEGRLTAVFSHIGLLDTTERNNLASGLKRDILPLRAMHSFDTGRSNIAWVIRVEGEIPRWPGIWDEYPVVVLPAGKGVRGMSNLKIAVRKQPAQFQPGEEIAGAAQWQLDRAPQAVEVWLLWHARGTGNRKIGDVCVVSTIRLDSLLQEDTRPFHFTAPAAPSSFTGKLIALEWFLELVALPSEDNARISLEIAPGGETIVLGDVFNKI